ncbi:AAA family ATPase [Acidiphilium multivorum]|uniref:AAA domain-containing protein n=1 Tax=Acidiphilium multivorum TaxID=62140 RepID=UPI001F4C118A|nr:AAA domain-containing protein [Acidiphilium multivorum]UNC13965.1 AAA family ATPase [Acidiphilium multivorum]
MVLLHYNNLGVENPDVLAKSAFYKLGNFFRFLERTKKYMEGDEAVLRLAFEPVVPPEGLDEGRGVWVQLKEPPDRPNEPDSTFRAFMDENVREVFEVPALDVKDAASARRVGQRTFVSDRKIGVLDRDPDTSQLLLERKPTGDQVLLRPNTLTLRRQIEAIRSLQNEPSLSHLPLLRLTQPTVDELWPRFTPEPINDWLVLSDAERPGTNEQRDFVRIAVATPDFAFLEGPPGSGKTTAICELILQLVRQGKRALLCASTHVAVDNVLERLMDERNANRDLVIPVRIGERRNVSDKARPWQLENFVKSERERLLRELNSQQVLSESRHALLEELRHGTTVIERMVLEAANVVCGTTIGILQHPDIKASRANASFDVLIVDEASKTTFQEFLVPALHAKRWVIVGDPKQLSPYVDDAATAVNVEACLTEADVRNACIDVFLAANADRRRRRVAAVVTDTRKALEIYRAQAVARSVSLADAATSDKLEYASLVVGDLESIRKRERDLPLDVVTVRAPPGELDTLRRRADAWLHLEKREKEEQPQWSKEIAWRLARLYEQRFAKDGANVTLDRARPTTRERLREQVEGLLPAAETGLVIEEVWNGIDVVRRVALPSILESLRYGFERGPKDRRGTALSDGLPETALKDRHVLLTTQHRMHPDIASFSHEHIYDGEALITPEKMREERKWSFDRHAHRAVWVDVRGGFNDRFNSNPNEARAAVEELRQFDEWAARNPRKDGRCWEAAVLTFYRGQEREMRSHLRDWTKQPYAMRHFMRGTRQRPYLSVELCTVDRFQGHEADLVIITIARPRSNNFLDSPNRLNVALTRSRYQRIIVGDRPGLARDRGRGGLLAELAADNRWDLDIRGGTR